MLKIKIGYIKDLAAEGKLLKKALKNGLDVNALAYGERLAEKAIALEKYYNLENVEYDRRTDAIPRGN
jgi:hypothetical protein